MDAKHTAGKESQTSSSPYECSPRPVFYSERHAWRCHEAGQRLRLTTLYCRFGLVGAARFAADLQRAKEPGGPAALLRSARHQIPTVAGRVHSDGELM
jgi:hypothetical protein